MCMCTCIHKLSLFICMNIYVCVCVCAHVLKYLCIQNQIMYKSALTTVTHTGHPATHCNTADTLQH